MTFPHEDILDVEGLKVSADLVLEELGKWITDERKEKLADIASRRTFAVPIVMDGIHDRGNISAVIRTAEALAFHEFHIIETQGKFKRANRVTKGADRWLDIHRWSEPAACLLSLKERGYQLAITHLEESVSIDEVDFTKPTALIFGNEHEGVSQQAFDLADIRVRIPMDGFVQSFNISVAAALGMYHARMDRLQRQGFHGDLTQEQQKIVQAIFYTRTVHRARRILKIRLDEDART